MKTKLVLTLMSLCPLLAQADVLVNPVYPGTQRVFVYFAWNCSVPGTCPDTADWNGEGFLANEPGVCKALGYESAVKGSAKSKEGSDGGPRLQVDGEGNITGAVAGRTLNQIECLNKVTEVAREKITAFAVPTHPQTGLPFARKSTPNAYSCTNEPGLGADENAVCRILGHERAVLNSGLTQRCPAKRPSTQVDVNGVVTGTQEAYALETILCVDKNKGAQ